MTTALGAETRTYDQRDRLKQVTKPDDSILDKELYEGWGWWKIS